MTPRTKILLLVLAIVVSFASGRWLAPTKVVTKIQTVEVVKTVDNTQMQADRDKHSTTTTTETVKPDGTKTTTTTTTQDSETHKATNQSDISESTKETESSKEVTRSTDKVTIAVLGALKLNDLTAGPAYGAMVYKPILGPFRIRYWIVDKHNNFC